MNSFRSTFKIIVMITALGALLVNCSTVNPDSPLSFVDRSGNHPDGWVAAHGPYAAPDGTPCIDCHGDDLAGGIAGISCSSDAVGCHAGGPAFHPDSWLDSSLVGNDWHGDAYDNGFPINGLNCSDALCHGTIIGITWPDTSRCVECHFTSTGGRYPIGSGWAHADTGAAHASYAGSPEESVCTTCHEVNISFGNQDTCHNCHEVATHEVEYLDHNLDVPTSGDFTASCSICHSISGTSPNPGAPLCISCHTNSSPYSGASCTSCHGRPPGSGQHGEHSGASCSACHQNAGSGTGLNHYYDGEVDIEFSELPFTYDPGASECTGTCHIGSETEGHTNRGWF